MLILTANPGAFIAPGIFDNILFTVSWSAFTSVLLLAMVTLSKAKMGRRAAFALATAVFTVSAALVSVVTPSLVEPAARADYLAEVRTWLQTEEGIETAPDALSIRLDGEATRFIGRHSGESSIYLIALADGQLVLQREPDRPLTASR